MSQCARTLNKAGGNRTRIYLIIVFALFAASCVPSSPVQEQVIPSPELMESNTPAITQTTEPLEESNLPTAEIDTRMAKLVDFVPLAGIAIGIQFKGEIYEQGYGLANVENGKLATMQTEFKIASLTKSFTAAAILHLSEEGKLSLDDSIARFLPKATEVAKDVRVRHLLNHTSGLPDMSIDTAQASLPETFTTAQVVDYYFSTVRKLEFQPGKA
jgi:CubicO group peptidase (beta-lactamase class C family)